MDTDCRCGRPGYGAVQGRLRHGRARFAVGLRDARLTGAVWGLSGAGAECQRDVPPGVEVRCGGRQVQDHAADRADDVRPQFEEPVAQPRHLGAGTGGARRAQPEFLHQHVGGRR